MVFFINQKLHCVLSGVTYVKFIFLPCLEPFLCINDTGMTVDPELSLSFPRLDTVVDLSVGSDVLVVGQHLSNATT